jgi:long-chain acyl-CoA synthetase
MPRGPFPDIGSVEVTPPTTCESPIRRCASSNDQLLTRPREGVDTVTDVLYYTARKHGNRKAFGWRDILKTHVEEKEAQKTIGGKTSTATHKWTYFELSGYKWISYIQMKEYAVDLAKGLVELGMVPSQIFNIYAGTG